MAYTSVQRVRNKIGDKETIRRETAKGDGVSANFKLRFEPVVQSPSPEVWVGTNLQTEGADYDINYEQGVVEFSTEPATNEVLTFQYYSVVWTDADIQDYLDQYGDNVNISAAHILFAWAADIAKIAKRETLQGGGGLGAVTRDTSVASKELRASAQALLDYEAEYGDDIGANIPAEGLTEVAWTEIRHSELAGQAFVRDDGVV